MAIVSPRAQAAALITGASSGIGLMSDTERRLPKALVATAAGTAAAGLSALDRNRRVSISGWAPRALNFTGGHAPRALWLRACRKLMA